MFPVADEMRLAYITETAWGTTPATPAFTKLRNTGESFKVVRNKGKSTELDPSRNVKDMVTQSGGAAILQGVLVRDWPLIVRLEPAHK